MEKGIMKPDASNRMGCTSSPATHTDKHLWGDYINVMVGN